MPQSTATLVLPSIEELFIPDAIDVNLKNNAEQPFFTFSDPAAHTGIRIINHREFGRAAHRIAHALRPNRSGPEGEVIAIIALSDTILYQAILVGCMIAGMVPFPISPRNPPVAIINLLNEASCHRVLATTITLKPLMDSLRESVVGTVLHERLKIEEVPSLSMVYPNLGHEMEEHSFEAFPPTLHPLSNDDLCIYIHSSGSTGAPKAIRQTHLAWKQWAAVPVSSVGNRAAPHLLPVVPSADNILEHTKLTHSTLLVAVPSLLQTWAKSPDSIQFLASLDHVIFAGSALAPKLGDLLVESGVRLCSIYGATEFGSPVHAISLIPGGSNSDWEYIRFHEHTKIRWVPQGDGTFECQFLAWEKHTPMVLNLLDVEGFTTSDLFFKHPTKKDLWKIVGRKDDLIVHTLGEKTVPAPMESIIITHPLVRDVIIFGHKRDQTGVLIEPVPNAAIDVGNTQEVIDFVEKIWPSIEDANRHAPAFSRLFKEMVLITSHEKPLPRAGKGSVMRKAALTLYEQEISALYDRDNSQSGRAIALPSKWSIDEVEAWIIEQATDLVAGVTLTPSVDLFEHGFDSSSATVFRIRLVRALRASVEESVQAVAQHIPQNAVHSYPIIHNLASFIVSLFDAPSVGDNDELARHVSVIEDMVNKYSSGFDDSSTLDKRASKTTGPTNVLLTGSTGNLGSEILAFLLQDSRVDHIYAFNRPSRGSTIQERHAKIFEEHGLDAKLLDTDKLSFVIGDATEPNLGLDNEEYTKLCKSVNVLIHNAWRLDFNLSLSAFESHIRGTRNLIDFMKSSPNVHHGARFLFTSSIGCAQSWPASKGSYPEEVVLDASFAVGAGYGEGKYVAERVVVNSGVEATSFRIGQVCGSRPKGAWAVTDWVPILVKSSISIGMLPDLEGVVSWIPMNTTAETIVDAALAQESYPRVMNLVHPEPTEAKQIITYLKSSIQDRLGRDLKVVPFSEWIDTIDQHARSATAERMIDIPAIKLLSFFRSLSIGNDFILSSSISSQDNPDRRHEMGGLATFSTESIKKLRASRLDGIGKEDVQLWVEYWHEVGYLV